MSIHSVRSRARRRRGLAAYTAVEVMMSLAVLAVGVVGVIATEKVTVASNLHAKNLSIASHIAEAWMGMLDAEAALWGTDGALTRTIWLQQGTSNTSWFRPNYNGGLMFGPAFDALGNPVTVQNQVNDAKFCVDVRLSPITATNNGGGMMRAEVRVFWLRLETIIGGTAVGLTNPCALLATEVDQEDQRRLLNFVYMSGAVRQVGK
jgi:hypothetical protein